MKKKSILFEGQKNRLKLNFEISCNLFKAKIKKGRNTCISSFYSKYMVVPIWLYKWKVYIFKKDHSIFFQNLNKNFSNYFVVTIFFEYS